MPLITLILRYLLIIYKHFNQSKVQHLKKYWVAISVNILKILKRTENGFFCWINSMNSWIYLTNYDFYLINPKMFMWSLQKHFCLLSLCVYFGKTYIRTPWNLCMLVEFGGYLIFLPPVFSLESGNLQYVQNPFIAEREYLTFINYMNCIFKHKKWHVNR